MNVKISQVVYDQSHVQHCLEGADIYDNTGKCDIFFENSIIANIEVPECDYFGVLSWKFTQKIFKERGVTIKSVGEIADQITSNIDALTFHKSIKRGSVESFHKGFSFVVGHNHKKIFAAIFGIPPLVEHPIYCNYFVAKREVFLEFQSYLKSKIEIIKASPILLEQLSRAVEKNSVYYRKTPPPELEMEHYPIAPFVFEGGAMSFFSNKIKKVYG